MCSRAPSDLRQGMNRLAHLLRAEGTWEWAYTFERGRKTGMLHSHALIRGGWREDRKGKRTVQARARKAGFGWVSVQAPRTDGVGWYAAKAARYAAKGAKTYLPWLEWNGGKRPWHWSRGFFDGMPARDFVRLWAPSSDPGPWRSVFERDVPRDLFEAFHRESQAEYAARVASRVAARAAEIRARPDPLDALVGGLPGSVVLFDPDPNEGRSARRRNAWDGFRGAALAKRRREWIAGE